MESDDERRVDMDLFAKNGNGVPGWVKEIVINQSEQTTRPKSPSGNRKEKYEEFVRNLFTADGPLQDWKSFTTKKVPVPNATKAIKRVMKTFKVTNEEAYLKITQRLRNIRRKHTLRRSPPMLQTAPKKRKLVERIEEEGENVVHKGKIATTPVTETKHELDEKHGDSEELDSKNDPKASDSIQGLVTVRPYDVSDEVMAFDKRQVGFHVMVKQLAAGKRKKQPESVQAPRCGSCVVAAADLAGLNVPSVVSRKAGGYVKCIVLVCEEGRDEGFNFALNEWDIVDSKGRNIKTFAEAAAASTEQEDIYIWHQYLKLPPQRSKTKAKT